MRKPKEIEVVIDTEGNVTVGTTGFAGAECERASHFLEDALGTRTRNVRTGEFQKSRQSAGHLEQKR